jgi:hypothetical protein
MTTTAETSHRLTEKVLALIEAGVDAELSDDQFNDYCMQIFALHYESNKIFREFCDIKKVKPGDVTRWQDVPMVYNDVFKTHLVASFPLEQSVSSAMKMVKNWCSVPTRR